MASESICILGESGTGKSTSLRNLNPKETFIISTTAKSLPFRGHKSKYTPLVKKDDSGEWTGNYYVTSDYKQIIKLFNLINKKLTHFKQIIIDDFQYVLSYEFVDRASETGYSKFTELAQHIIEILRFSETMRDDCKIIYLTHSENTGDTLNPKYGIKTIGKLLSEKVTLEGLFTYVFFTIVQESDIAGKMEYKFLTNTDGERVAKTPMGMFDDLLIDNDLKEILSIIDEYNNEE